MFAHIFTYRLKCLLRDRTIVFWTMLFPILLALFFNLSLRNLATNEEFHPIPVATVNDAAYRKDTGFRAALKGISEGGDKIVTVTETTEKDARQLLADGKVDGVFTVKNGLKLQVSHSGFNQSILQSFADAYLQTSSAMEDILKSDPAAYEKLVQNMKQQTEYLKDQPISSANPDYTLCYFYSLIAMACLYTGFWGLKEITDIQANLSERAARVNVAPVHKLKAFLSSMAAAFVVSFSEILIFLAFLRFCLNIDFGPCTGYVIFTSFVGCVVGLSLGAFISAVTKGRENIKLGLLLGYTMTGCVLAGMMYQGVKTIVQDNAPILGYLNPVNLLSDAFYALYYYTVMSRYWLNIGLLGAFALVFCTGTYLMIRRRKYASL